MGLCTRESFNKYFAVFILTAINLLNYMDRYTLAGILSELETRGRSGFRGGAVINDLEGGLLQTAFIVSYMLLSPLFGYLGDRFTRKYIVTFGIVTWAAFTLVGSFSVNYAMLLGTRLFVGIGEASYATIAPTIIADLFPTNRRLRMLTIFYIAVPLGSALGYIVGSEVSAIVFKDFHSNASWRWALRITPGLGFIAALLVLFVMQEPPRGHTDGHRSPRGIKGKSGLSAYARDVWYCLNNATFVLTTLGFTSVAFTTGALAQWAPTFVRRVSYIVTPASPYSVSTSAIVFGGITVVAGISGTVSGSELSKFLGRRTRKAEAIVCAMGMLLGTPLLFLALSVPQFKHLYVAWILVFFAEFFLCLPWAPVSAILLYSVVPERRSTAEAVQILISHLFGDATSPFITGAISDAIFGATKGYFRSNHAIPGVPSNYLAQATVRDYSAQAVATEFALYTTTFVCLLGGVAFLMATFTVEKDRRAVETDTTAANSKVQRSGIHLPEESSSSSSEGFDEHHALLHDSIANYNT